jgi:hypothetical protein
MKMFCYGVAVGAVVIGSVWKLYSAPPPAPPAPGPGGAPPGK